MGKFNPRLTFSCDTETNGVRPWHGDEPFAVSLCDADGNTLYFEWAVNPFTRKVSPDEADLLFLRRILGREKGVSGRSVIFHNSKFDVHMLRNVGVEVRGINIEDTFIAARVCNTLEPSYKLKFLAYKYADVGNADEKALQSEVNRCRRIGRTRGWNLAKSTAGDYWLPRAVDSESTHCEEYAVLDAVRTMYLWEMYNGVVMSEPSGDWQVLRRTYEKEMRQVWDIINEIEERGVRVDKTKNSLELEKAKRRAADETERIRGILVKDKKYAWRDATKTGRGSNEEFNPGSDQQLARVLFSRERDGGYGLRVTRYTAGGAPSTDWKALREHLTHPFVQSLVVCRSASKAVSTYFENYDELMLPDPLSGEDTISFCIHPSFNQLGAGKTSRLSSSSPNLQNVADSSSNPNSPAPIQAREPFGPRKGYCWYCLDFAQQELRIYAECAQIKSMLESCLAGRDINTDNANLAWGGRGNPHANQAAAYALELGQRQASRREVVDAWRVAGWNSELSRLGVGSREALKAAELWLAGFGFDIVAAEASLGKKGSRTRAKNLGYAKIYGAGAGGVMDMLFCSRIEAKEMLRRFDEIHPGMKRFASEFCSSAAQRGWIYNLYGRRLNVDGRFAYRAVNYLVQGCIKGDSQIVTKEHGPVEIRSVRGPVTVWDGEKWAKASVVASGEKQLVRLTLTGDVVVECSSEHRFLCTNTQGNTYWKSPKEFSKQEYIKLGNEVEWACPVLPELPTGNCHNANNCCFEEVSRLQLGEWLGRIASDGSVCRGNGVYLLVAAHEVELLPYLECITRKIGRCTVRSQEKCSEYAPLYRIDVYSASLANFLSDSRIRTRIPKWVWRDKELLRGYLRGMFDGDGTVGAGGPLLTFGKGRSYYLKFARDVQRALGLFGIRSRINQCADRINVRVWKKDSPLFAERIGFMNRKKQALLESVTPSNHYRKTNSQIYGRSLRVDAVKFTNKSVEMYDVVNSETGRFMINGLIAHNSGADMMKESMIRCREYIRRTGLDAHIVMTVHDELVFEIRREHSYLWLLRGLRTIMQNVGGMVLTVPMPVECSRARERWNLKEKVEL